MNLALAIANSTYIGKALICYLVILKNHCARFDALRHTRIILILLIIQRYRENHRQIKLQRLKVKIWAFASLVHQSTLYKKFLNWNKIFEKMKQLLVKLYLLCWVHFCTLRSICFSIGFCYASFEWKWFVFNLSAFNGKTVLQFFEKDFRFPENLFQS